MNKPRVLKLFSGEVFFALFLIAGYYKADPRLEIIQSHFDLTLLFFFLSFGAFIIRVLRSGPTYKLPGNFIILSSLFSGIAACILLGLIYSPSKSYATDKALRFLFITGWAYFGAILLIRDIGSLKKFLSTLVVVAIFMSLDAAFCRQGAGTGQFVTVFGSNYIALARISGVALLAIFGLFLEEAKGWTVKGGLVAVGFLLFWALMVAGARGPVIAFVISVLVYLFGSVRLSQGVRFNRFALNLGIAVVIIAVFIVIFANQIGIEVIINRFTVFFQEEGGGTSASQRWNYYDRAIELLKMSPFFGAGTGAFGVEYYGEDLRAYPHNILLELWAENGLLGLMLMLVMIGYTLGIRIVRLPFLKAQESVIIRCLVVLGCFMLFNSMLSGDINDNRLLFTFLALNGTALSFAKGKIHQRCCECPGKIILRQESI